MFTKLFYVFMSVCKEKDDSIRSSKREDIDKFRINMTLYHITKHTIRLLLYIYKL